MLTVNREDKETWKFEVDWGEENLKDGERKENKKELLAGAFLIDLYLNMEYIF